MSDDIADALAKFDRYRTGILPTLAAAVQREGRTPYESILWLSDRWAVLYSGPEGLSRVLRMLDGSLSSIVPIDVLEKKRNAAETALLDIGQRFLNECTRLGWQGERDETA
jgi:hypothetical protein